MRQDHGYARYVNKKDPCRCDVCRAGKAAHVAEARANAAGLPLGDRRHGTRNGYQHHGCRCRPCQKAQTAATLRSYHAVKARAS